MYVRPKILLVEDQPLISEFVRTALERRYFEVTEALSYAETIELLKQQSPTLIVLDVVLPDGDGYHLCRTLRSGGEGGIFRRLADVPILMLSAQGDEQSRLLGFQAGADDYVVKPFNPDELVYRIQAILRRCQGVSHALIDIGPLHIDPFAREVKICDQTLVLTPKEFDLLHLLASKPGQVFTREELLERVWDYSYHGNTRTVDVHINRLRQKLVDWEHGFDPIMTEWGVGYKVVAAGDGTSAHEWSRSEHPHKAHPMHVSPAAHRLDRTVAPQVRMAER